MTEMVLGAYKVEVPKQCNLRQWAVSALQALGPAEMIPMHYRKVAELAWRCGGWTPPDEESARQSAEDLRRLANDGDDEIGYVSGRVVGRGNPAVTLMFLREWLPEDQLLLFQASPMTGLLDYDVCVEAGVETALRLPHMVNKFGDRDYYRAVRASGGFIVEGSVRAFFKRTWPAQFIEPSNHGRYDRWAADDFKMKTVSGVKTFDVKRPTDGVYKRRDIETLKADIYLLSHARGNKWVCDGWCDDQDYTNGLYPENARRLSRLFVMLNCMVAGIDYKSLLKAR